MKLSFHFAGQHQLRNFPAGTENLTSQTCVIRVQQQLGPMLLQHFEHITWDSIMYWDSLVFKVIASSSYSCCVGKNLARPVYVSSRSKCLGTRAFTPCPW